MFERNFTQKAFFLLFTLAICTIFAREATALALPTYTVGSSKVIHQTVLYIEGEIVENNVRYITVHTDTPTFFGYTVPNIKIHLRLLSEQYPVVHIDGSAVSDAHGYWTYPVREKLPRGKYTLFMTEAAYAGAQSPFVRMSGVEVVENSKNNPHMVLWHNTPPYNSLRELNHITVSLLIVGFVLCISILNIIVHMRQGIHATTYER